MAFAPIKASAKGGKDFEPIPAGVHMAICTQVIDLGWQPQNGKYPAPKHQVYLKFEIPDHQVTWTKDGNTVTRHGTVTGPNGKTTTSESTTTRSGNTVTRVGTTTGPKGKKVTTQNTWTNDGNTITHEGTTCAATPDGRTYCERGPLRFVIEPTKTWLSAPWMDLSWMQLGPASCAPPGGGPCYS